jgi:hypothetical protein
VVYEDGQGNQWVEWWTAADTGHGVPIDPANSCGIDLVPNLSDFQPLNDYVIDDGLCSTRYIAQFWGLLK